MSLKDSSYALKNALFYTLLVTCILLVPLYIYTLYSKTIYEIENELILKEHATRIIRSMQEYDSIHEEYFEFPRFKSIESGLYDLQFKPIFTLITKPLLNLSEGYHIYNNYAYLVLSLPKERYFSAEYLIVATELSYASVYLKVASILLSITMLVLLLSFFFLKRFALPFKRVNKKLDNFIKDSMHEINTPLSIINVNIDLHNRKFPQTKYLQRIKTATKILSTIYDDMDYLIKNRQRNFEIEAINLKDFLYERVNYFAEVAAMKEIKLLCLQCDDLMITFNTTQLQRIIDNNISNAIKYSEPKGKVEVSLHDFDKGCKIIFRDYGVGMKNPEKIFERYYRESSQVGGFGIGLNIVKAIIDEHNISLHVSSVYNEGSTFIYTFPANMKQL